LEDFCPAAALAAEVVRSALSNGIPEGVLLNINVPFLPLELIKGFQITRQGLRVYHDKIDRRMDPRGRPYYWIIGETPTGIPESGTDIGALSEGYVSITPVHLDMTNYSHMLLLSEWQIDLPILEHIQDAIPVI
jgi:5'-nucleotidase